MNEHSAAARWNQRYDVEEYLFGTAPNDFLADMADRLPIGRALCLAEGEGRNAVFLSERGHDVTAVDASLVGLLKAERLARERGAGVRTIASDLSGYEIEPEHWDVVVLIFAHLPAELRRSVHGAAVRGLKRGGAFVLEAFTPEPSEVDRGGGPPDDLRMRLEVLRDELPGLRFDIAREIRREIHEGTRHNGVRPVVQILGFRV